MKKVNYKAAWKKLKEATLQDLVVSNEHYSTKRLSSNACELGEAIEYSGMICSYQFILKAMEELEGKKHHNIFTFKGSK